MGASCIHRMAPGSLVGEPAAPRLGAINRLTGFRPNASMFPPSGDRPAGAADMGSLRWQTLASTRRLLIIRLAIAGEHNEFRPPRSFFCSGASRGAVLLPPRRRLRRIGPRLRDRSLREVAFMMARVLFTLLLSATLVAAGLLWYAIAAPRVSRGEQGLAGTGAAALSAEGQGDG